MKKFISAIVFGIAIIVAAYLLGRAIINRNHAEGMVSVTGLGKADFTSDLIVWEGSFSETSLNLQNAYVALENDKKIISDYLVNKGIKKEDIVFNAVNSRENNKARYSPDGNYIGEDFLGYILTQSIKVESNDVEKVENISREITELLNKGIQFYSQPPRYYYTKLADLKIEMISKATADARQRAEKIAENSGAKLGDLISANMGVFQITGQNSDENYSWGGTYNTIAKDKTASITMKLDYKID